MIRFLAAMLDSIRRLFADKGARTTMVVSILIYAVLYPQPYTAEVVRDVPIVVIDQDGSTASRELLRRIDNTDSVQIAATANGLPEAQRLFFERRAYGIVIVPPNFERDLLHGRQAPIAAFGDAGYFILYGAMANAVNTAARSLGAEVKFARLTAMGVDENMAKALAAPVTVASVALFNPNGGYASYIVPAAFVLIIQQTLLMGIGIMHAGRPTRKGIPRFATPVAYVTLYSVWVAATQLLLPRLYGIPTLGEPWAMFAVAVPFLIAVTAMGFALIQLIPSREGVIFFLVVQGLPLFFLTGISWPIESVPDVVRWLAMIIPSTSALSAFIRVDQMAAPIAVVLPTIGLQLALAMVYGTLAYLLHRWRFPHHT